jgi:predicted nucleic acid-binding protein
VELVRSVPRGGPAAVAHARRQLARLYLVVLDRQVLDEAATLAPGSLFRSLDAIHLATAQLMDSELRSIVTYDARMAQAATGLGLSVAAPTDAV